MASPAPWKQLLLTALDSNSHLKHANFIQIATVGFNGKPSNRTVVFRGFSGNSDKFQINTDLRTNKVEDIKHCPFAEVCWYFTETWEQFRINGKIDIIDGLNSSPLKLQQRETAWFESSLKSRSQYLGNAPGFPSIYDETSMKQTNLNPSTGPVDAFCLLVFDPEKVDYLNLKSNNRVVFTVSKPQSEGCKNWISKNINP
ncbi:Pyridoxal 5'-phosphate synthase [Zostera marina]|uniref:pyridoxal 5'-phosphate synthase n=1 Tax=Zostera marina TaxID=29655 RepID=A0A0K9NSR9_ZOSMR|nr:Pyridoxal 5'-phosphate synthase [Zostera marina]